MNLKKLSYGCCVVGAACLVGLGCNRSRLVLEPDGGASDPGGEAAGAGGAAGSEAVPGGGGFGGSGGVGAAGGGGGVAGAGGSGGFTGGNTGGNGGTVGDAGAEGDPAAGGTGGNDGWEPAIDHVNGTGWRNSTEPLCPKAGENLFGLSVWADARGTFVAVRSEADGSTMPLPDFCTGEICSRTDIFFNEGNGWQPWVRLQDELTHIEGGMQMRGLQGGPLVVANGLADTVRHQGCPLGMLRDDEGGVSTECESQPTEVHDLFTVGSSLAYAISGDRVIRYDGDSWGPLPAVLPYNDIDALWANESQLVVAGGQGTVLSLEDGQWRPHDTGTLEYIVTLWGFGPDNLWAGTSNGTLLHYDGVEWQSIDWGTPPCEPAIKGMWGAEGVLYVHSRTALRRVADDGTIETIAKWNCTHNGSNPGIREVWGRGPNELFLVVHETQRPRRGCGSAYMLWYDGEELRWF